MFQPQPIMLSNYSSGQFPKAQYGQINYPQQSYYPNPTYPPQSSIQSPFAPQISSQNQTSIPPFTQFRPQNQTYTSPENIPTLSSRSSLLGKSQIGQNDNRERSQIYPVPSSKPELPNTHTYFPLPAC